MINKINLSDFYTKIKLYNNNKTKLNTTKYYIDNLLNNLKNEDYILKIYGVKDFNNYYKNILIQIILNNNSKIKNCINFTISCKKSIPIYKVYQSFYLPDSNLFFITKNCKYLINKLDYTIDFNIKDFLNFNNNYNLKNEIYDLNELKNNIFNWMYLSNINISNNEYENIKLSNKIFLKIYGKLDLKKQLFYKSEIYKILNDDLNNCSKDLSNRFEKMLLINNIL